MKTIPLITGTLTLLSTAFAAPSPQGAAAGSCSALELIIGNF
jgi:hypothetical protein